MKLGLLASAFDPFPHPGRLWAMKQALDAGVCDGIAAAMHIDPSIENPRKRKPAMLPNERRMMLEALQCVASVLWYETEADLLALIRYKRPACLIVGEDHRDDPVTGADLAPIFWARRLPEWSSTQFAKRISDAYLEHQARRGATA